MGKVIDNMDIEIGEFVLKGSTATPGRFDLIRKVERTRKGTDETYPDYNELAFSMRLDSALQLIIGTILSEDNRTVTLKEYLQAYITERDKITNQINQITNIKIQTP